jgi:hypothetical protein
MLGLDLIGAGESLAAYTIMVRVKSIDPAKLRQTIADKATWGGAIPGVISMVDSAPEMALGVALPVLKGQLEKIGITADLSTTQKPPKAAPRGEVFVTLGVGAVLGIVLALGGRALYHLVSPARAK